MGKIESAVESIFKTRETVRQQRIAEEKDREEERRSKELQKERAEEARFLECKRVIKESPCQELFEEVNNIYLNGKGSISLERSQDSFSPYPIYTGSDRDRNLVMIGPGAKLSLKGYRKGKSFQLQAFVSRAKRDYKAEFMGLEIRCFSRGKRLLDRLSIGKQKWDSSYSDIIREENDWKNPDKVANAIATVLVEQRITG